jgi:CPA2 family monovalent cation:H+ antiporter-2
LGTQAGLLFTFGAALIVAFICGFVAERFRVPALIGFILAGVLLGPHTPGLVADQAIADQLASVGIILLLFGAGLQFSVRDLIRMRKIALPGGLLGMAISVSLGFGFMQLAGWETAPALVVGLSLVSTSTVVILRNMTERSEVDSLHGRTLLTWSIVEDLSTVTILVMLPTLVIAFSPEAESAAAGDGGTTEIARALAIALGKVALFAGLMLLFGSRLLPWLLNIVAKTGSRELFILAVLGSAIGIASGAAALFDVSVALGAFLAGVVLSETDLSHQTAAEALPLRDAFAVLFFVAIGMLFNPFVLLDSPLLIMGLVGVILISKPLAGVIITTLSGFPLRNMLLTTIGLAQVGEFALLVAGLGNDLGVLSADGLSLVIAGAAISIIINSLLFKSANPTLRWLERRQGLVALLERRGRHLTEVDPDLAERMLRGHAVLCGAGRVGSMVAQVLERRRIPYIVIDSNRTLVQDLRRRGVTALFGDASSPVLLGRVNIPRARVLIVAIPDQVATRRIVDYARDANPRLDIVARTHSLEEKQFLERRGTREAVVGELELGIELTRHTLHRFGLDTQEILAILQGLRAGQRQPGRPDLETPAGA